LEVARIVKELHPQVPVILGGLSSSYFHRELIGYPQVDYVLRGDSTEPPLHQLLLALQSGAAVDKIPNLTWKDAAGIHVNPLSFVPMSLDYVDLRPDLMVEMVMRYRDLQSTSRRCSPSKVALSNASPAAARPPPAPTSPSVRSPCSAVPRASSPTCRQSLA
jgi:radical SAM superfamily enzyme YgiQ (UPF0313 family)